MATMTTATRRMTEAGPRSGRQHDAGGYINVGDSERWLSLVGGGLLGIYGLTRRSLGGLALAAAGGSLAYRGVTGHCSLYGALGLNTADHRGPATSIPAGHGVKVEESVIINRDPADLYRYWRNLENLGRFMHHLERVERIDDRRSRWVARGPLGAPVSWEAEIINDKPNELIAWRSREGSTVDTAGSVHFRRLPDGRSTEVRVVLKYDPPAGKAGAAVAGLLGASPECQIREDLQRLKQVMETGGASTSSGQPAGQRGR